MIVLSHIQIAPLLRRGQARSGEVMISPDLGLSQVRVELSEAGLAFDGVERLSWEDAQEIAESETACFALEQGTIRKIQAFSDVTNRHCSLMPTRGAPTILIAGFPMHRIKDTDPLQDTTEKIKAARPTGRVLDTSMGLGYTAIYAARTAAGVTTIELDPTVVEVARQNPYSRELFANPRIERLVGDSFDFVETFDTGMFTCILHDPPTMQLAGDLYSGDYYAQLYRILSSRGRLFHYIGDLNSAFGSRVARGVVERLKKAGFSRVTPAPQAFGLTAVK